MSASRKPLGLGAGLVANVLVLGLMAYVFWLEGSDPDAYRLAIQEDEYLEWATFWAFLLGSAVFGWAAVVRRRSGEPWPWFLAGLAVFCFLVAGEEISWAQRIFGYRPAAYFLEHNFQQEPNLHNVVSTSLRKLTLKSIIAGYGVLLPLSVVVPALRRLWTRWRVVPPPGILAPIFIASFWVYEAYPLDYSGEIVELMLGLGFLIAALAAMPAGPKAGRMAPAARVALAWSLAMALGMATAAAARNQRNLWPVNVELARAEVEALRADFERLADPARRRFATRCGVHKRVYTFVQDYDRPELGEGDFSRLQKQGLPEERARFFIDPWNAPYWVRDRCSSSTGRRSIFVYSFGPNRRRDSGTWEIRGDDIGAYVYVGER